MRKVYWFSLHEGGSETKGKLKEDLKSTELEMTLDELDIVKGLAINQSCSLRDGYLVVKRLE